MKRPLPIDSQQRRAANLAAGKIEQAGIDALIASWPAGYTIAGKRTPGSGISGFIADTEWKVTAPSGEVVGRCITDTRRDVMEMYARAVHVHAFLREAPGVADTLLGIPVVIDPSIPEGEIHLVSRKSRAVLRGVKP